MKPLNNDNPTCNPISSNCVIWQGPDIPCIKLCKGDTVSDTVYKLATELCSILEQIDVNTYDLTCLNLSCEPKDFHALIQILIDKICELSGCCAQNTGGGTREFICPDDCIVEICAAFQYTDSLGNLVTTMPLKDYVIAIGNKVCSIVQQITTINATLQNHETRITYIEENCCDNDPQPLPSLVPTCIGTPPNPLVLDDFVQILEAAFCELRTATGTATELYSAIAQQCPGLDNEQQLSGIGVMGTIPGWVTSSNYGTVADAINNMWLTICDMRAAIKYIQDNCCPGNCEDFVINLVATFTSPVMKFYFTGSIPVGYIACNPSGTTITVSDLNGNSTSTIVDVVGNINNPSGIPFDLSVTPLNLISNFTVGVTVCVTDPITGSQCSSKLTYVVNNQASCPALELDSTSTTVTYNLNAVAAGTYVVDLLSSCGSTSPILTNTHVVAGAGVVSGVFSPLASNTAYVVRVTVQNYDGETLLNQTVCPCSSVTTLPGLCDTPVMSTITPPYVQYPIS
jgi:hypothetical protein